MYDSGVVDFQNGDSSSRGLPASCVMMVFDTSAMCMRSQITRYGDSGFDSLVRRGIHSAIQGSLAFLMSAWIWLVRPRGFFSRSRSASCSMPSASFESPSSGCLAGMFLLMSYSWFVLCTNVLPCVGKRMPKPVEVKLAPAPNTTSDSRTQVDTALDMVGPPEPSANAWVSGKALLPSRLVHTGASSSSATALSSFQALP